MSAKPSFPFHGLMPPAKARGNLAGIGLMLLATLCFSVMQGAVRHMGNQGLHSFEIAFFRNFLGLFVILPWLFRYGWVVLRTERPGLHLARAVVNATSMLAFFSALLIAPLAQITALSFTAPLFATLLAVLFLHEIVGWQRWSALLVGFLGTLIVVRPGTDMVGLGPLLTLFGAVGYGMIVLMVKTLGRTDSSITITAYFSLLLAPMTLIPALFFWQWPSVEQWAWLVAIGILGNIGQLFLVQALQAGDTNVVMTFDFAKLLWMAAIGYLAFGQVPDTMTWIGGTVIFAAGAYIAYRERRKAAFSAESP